MRSAVCAVLVILLHVAVLGAAMATAYIPSGGAHPGTSAMQIDLKEGVPGLWWDERVWTPVVIPYEPEVMLCRADSLGSIRCFVLPPASLLFLPVPQEDK